MDNSELKKLWQESGFLLPRSDCTTPRAFEFTIFGKVFMGELATSKTGYWDDFLNSGNVHTTSIALRKCRAWNNGDILEFTQILFMKWAFSLAIMKEKRE